MCVPAGINFHSEATGVAKKRELRRIVRRAQAAVLVEGFLASKHFVDNIWGAASGDAAGSDSDDSRSGYDDLSADEAETSVKRKRGRGRDVKRFDEDAFMRMHSSEAAILRIKLVHLDLAADLALVRCSWRCMSPSPLSQVVPRRIPCQIRCNHRQLPPR